MDLNHKPVPMLPLDKLKEELYDDIALLWILYDEDVVDYNYVIDAIYTLIARYNKDNNIDGHCKLEE